VAPRSDRSTRSDAGDDIVLLYIQRTDDGFDVVAVKR